MCSVEADTRPDGKGVVPAIREAIRWPEDRTFAFTVFDDTDGATLENVSPVYALLQDLGFRTTKSVWPSDGNDTRAPGGSTCADEVYLAWLLQLHKAGFEIGYHMNTFHTSARAATAAGLRRFEEMFGHPPATMANHSRCEENIYWGPNRLTGIRRFMYNMATRYRWRGQFHGHTEGHPLFWGDLCRDRVTYCRNFVFPEINTLAACPMMPYHDPKRPWVNYWFASSEGPTIKPFVGLLSEANQDRLEREGGACIVYTHFAGGFCERGQVNTQFRALMERLSRKNGWFVPACTILDFLRHRNGSHVLTSRERAHLEWRWLRHKLRIGPS